MLFKNFFLFEVESNIFQSSFNLAYSSLIISHFSYVSINLNATDIQKIKKFTH
jgi:hypothetical protein